MDTVKEVTGMQKATIDILERMDKRTAENHKETIFALERIEEGQREIVKIIKTGQEHLAKMLLNQTKILERLYPQGKIEGKIK